MGYVAVKEVVPLDHCVLIYTARRVYEIVTPTPEARGHVLEYLNVARRINTYNLKVVAHR